MTQKQIANSDAQDSFEYGLPLEDWQEMESAAHKKRSLAILVLICVALLLSIDVLAIAVSAIRGIQKLSQGSVQPSEASTTLFALSAQVVSIALGCALICSALCALRAWASARFKWQLTDAGIVLDGRTVVRWEELRSCEEVHMRLYRAVRFRIKHALGIEAAFCGVTGIAIALGGSPVLIKLPNVLTTVFIMLILSLLFFPVPLLLLRHFCTPVTLPVWIPEYEAEGILHVVRSRCARRESGMQWDRRGGPIL